MRKTTYLSKVTYRLYHIMLYTSPWSRFELTTSVVIGTDCIGSCNSIYHTITATTAPTWKEKHYSCISPHIVNFCSWNRILRSINNVKSNVLQQTGDHRGRDHMVVGFTTTYAIGAYHHWCCGFNSHSGRGVQHYVIKFVSDFLQVGGYRWVLRFPPSIKLTTTI